ncbi:MAG: hypothetical protein C0399_03460 [Syntrophus sp. (in: bacteria)]|nr:hypothetical protein [Syntrophus sp. (in: bacteria)]
METLTANRYNDALQQIPAPGCGCHTGLLSVANLGALANLDGEQIFDDIRHAIPRGNRKVSDREIQDAINKALSDSNRSTFIPKPRPEPVVNDGKIALQRIIDQGPYSTEAELIPASPVDIPDEPRLHTKLFIETLYRHTDFLFIGERHDTTVKDAVDWLTFYIASGKTSSHIIVNPLTGSPAPKKTGNGETYRGDNNVKDFRFAMAEFDNLSLEDQIRFWSAVKLPIIALIHSGGKSIHAWLEVSKLATVNTLQEWQTEIKERLYDRILTPLGVDSACSNPARLSRLPGHFREEKGAWQRLLWLSPAGVSLCQ